MTETLLAHGVGGSTDLPIPLGYAVIGATWALTISFAVLGLAWRTPRLDPERTGRPLPVWVTTAVGSAALRTTIRALGLLFAAWVGLAAFGGPERDNALPGVFYVLLWVGIVPLALAFGHIWALISPLRTLHRWISAGVGRDVRSGIWTYPARLGYWPAAAGLFAFVWLELAWSDPGDVMAVRTWCLAYAVVMLAGSFAYGERWFERADPFDVYSALVARLSPFGRRTDGRVVLRNPLDSLGAVPVDNGLIAVIATLLGSTAFDSFAASDFWMTRAQRWTEGSTAGSVALHTAGLVSLIALGATIFWCACRATGGVSASQRAALPGLLAHSLVPIVVGYVLAHYLSYLVEKGQATLLLLLDPLARGWNPLGLADRDVSFFLSERPALLATLKVGFVVTGHVLAVIAAHDRSIRLLPKAHQLTGQLALLVAMVAYTFGGLYLLFSV